MCFRMKWTLFDIKFTTIMTASYPEDSGSFTMKFILRISYLISSIESGCNSPTRGCFVAFIQRHRSQILIYCLIYLNI